MKGISKNIVYLGIVSGLTDISSEMLYPIVPLFLTVELGASMTVVGLIEGVAEATASLMKAGAGWLSDRARRRKPYIVFGYSLSALAKPAVALAATWHLVLFARFFDRMGKGVRTAPRDALIAASTEPEHRGLAFGFHQAMDTAGAALGPLLALLLLNWAGFTYRKLFVVAFIPAALGVLILAALVKESPRAPEEAVPRPPLAGMPAFHALSPELKRLLFVYGIFALGNSSDVFLLLKAKSIGFSVTEVLLAYVAYNVVYAAASTPAGRLSDWFGRSRALAGGLVIFAAVYLGFARASSRPVLWSLFVLYGLYAATTEGVGRALVVDLSAPSDRGASIGLFQGVNGVLALAASAAAGFLWTHVSPQAPFLMGAACAAASAILFPLSFAR